MSAVFALPRRPARSLLPELFESPGEVLLLPPGFNEELDEFELPHAPTAKTSAAAVTMALPLRRVMRRSVRPSGPCARAIHTEIQESVGLVAYVDSRVGERDVPVAPASGIGLLHAVVGHEHE